MGDLISFATRQTIAPQPAAMEHHHAVLSRIDQLIAFLKSLKRRQRKSLMTPRIYTVTLRGGGDKTLVKAISQAQALRFVAEALLDIRVATAAQAVESLAAGTPLLDATLKPVADAAQTVESTQ
jgi:hypothetical protein